MLDRAPNFFVIGAAKAGTTTLHQLLRTHPQVYMPVEKEPAYFSDDEYYARGDDWYLKTFFRSAAGRAARGEATPAYLYFSEKVAPRIERFAGSEAIRLIAIFREPASLVYSYYWNSVREGREDLPFQEALTVEPERLRRMGSELARRGRMTYAYSRIAAYADQLQPYLARFPRDRFLFLLTKDLSNPSELAARLHAFLQLPDGPAISTSIARNAAALPRSRRLHAWLRSRSRVKDIVKPFLPRSWRYRLKLSAIEANLRIFPPPTLDEETAQALRRQYRQETERLQNLIQRDLTDWLPA